MNQPRRALLQWMACGSVAWAAGARAQAQPVETRSISLVNTHTGEALSARYFEAGQYVTGSLRSLDHLLRDHRSGESHPIDPRLFDLLHSLALCAECEPRFEIISGYRSPASNAKLHSASSGVATRSLHMEGRAIDVRLAGARCSRLRDLAMEMQVGGVGYYAKSDFVHLDTGRVRFWTG